ncbi:MAG: TIGR02757 family protein [Kiritimatiellae bacterium]|nr:TIGR02757 family protein [Kiritimatiellia bacterium]
MDAKTKRTLRECAAKYETRAFIEGDPSWFMHQVKGKRNMEATAFVASSLSFGSRAQFMPKIQRLLDFAEGDMDRWIRTGEFEKHLKPSDGACFYRFFSAATMNSFLRAYKRTMECHGSLGEFVKGACAGNAVKAVEAIVRQFRKEGSSGVIPKDAGSACKRVCMFLRWMVRSGSPVDLGLWAGFIDRKTLVVPLDTHVLQEAKRLGLLKSASASMSTAKKLTAALAEAFPEDPAKGDFALFGYGVSGASVKSPDCGR